MNNHFENFIQETELNRKIIIFCFVKDDLFRNNIIKFMKVLNIYNVHLIYNYDSLVETMNNAEISKINDNNYLFYFVADYSDICLIKSLKYFTRNRIMNYRLFTFIDYDIFSKNFFKNYLSNKGIDVTGQIINIHNFMFDNLLNKEYQGVFHWGDLILPTIFNDYTTIEEGPYEFDHVVINKDDVVFDCGANIGSFSALALAKGCELHAFEPIYETFLSLKHNLRHYVKSKQYLNNVGLSNRKGSIDFYINENNGASGYVNSFDSKETMKCNITTIDEYVKENCVQKVDFIKSDIEGAERDMLIGAVNTIRKFKPKLSICTYHSTDDPEIIESIIKNACSDYNIIHKWNKCYAYV